MVIEHLVTVAMMHDHFINYWSLWDLIMLVGIVALYIADVIVNNFYASAVFKIRALFRLFKITLHVQNIIDPHYKFKKKVKQVVHKSKGEEVAEILEGIKQKA